jgi:exodeoxyribonuclease VII large subunit
MATPQTSVGSGAGAVVVPLRPGLVIPDEPGADTTVTVAEALRLACNAVRRTAPSGLWVRGEVTGFTRTSAGHLFWNLTDGTERLAVAALGRTARSIDRALAHAEVTLTDGIVVRVFGQLDVWPQRSIVQLSATVVDPAVSVGEAVIARRQIRARLAAQGMLGFQRRIVPTDVPLRVGLVAPMGDGRRDVLVRLEASPWAWEVISVATPSEGRHAARAIAGAISRLAGRVDVIVVTRGGGAAATVVYDTERVAEAICVCPTPVVVAVGHSADHCLADEAAWRSLPTPTAAAELLESWIAQRDIQIVDATRQVTAAARGAVQRALTGLDLLAAELDAKAEAARRRITEEEATSRSHSMARVLAVTAAVAVVLLVTVILLILRGP